MYREKSHGIRFAIEIDLGPGSEKYMQNLLTECGYWIIAEISNKNKSKLNKTMVVAGSRKSGYSKFGKR